MEQVHGYFVEVLHLDSKERVAHYIVKNYTPLIETGDLSKNIDDTHDLKIVIIPIKTEVVNNGITVNRDKKNMLIYYAPPSMKLTIEEMCDSGFLA